MLWKSAARLFTLFCLLGATCLLSGPTRAATSTVQAITRTLEPVILTGVDLPGLQGLPVNQIFVYAFDGVDWRQIPAQVDEVDAAGAYVAVEDGVWDANDELVLMARDLGADAADEAPMQDGAPAAYTWYKVAVSDPLNPVAIGWAYVVYSDSLTQQFTDDYVSFQSDLHTMQGMSYEFRFASPRAWLDTLSMNGSSLDILDRAPKTRTCRSIWCVTEENAPDVPDGLIKDGPVRVLVRDGRVQSYGWMSVSEVAVDIQPPLALDFVRFSTDFNENAVGATLFNAVAPGGFTVNGVPETMDPTPFSPWWQLNHSTGTLIQASDSSGLGGTQTNYYLDSALVDNKDTADKRHYGEIGMRVDNPNTTFTYRFALYILPAQSTNIGADYQAYFENPLQKSATFHYVDLPNKTYVPTNLK